MQEANFVDPDPDSGKDFVADSPKGVVKRSGSGGTSTGGERSTSSPVDEIENHRDIAHTDPHVGEAVRTILDWVLGDGFAIKPRSINEELAGNSANIEADIEIGGGGGADPEQQRQIAYKLNKLLKQSNFWPTFEEWVKYASVDGHAFMELVVEDGQFKTKLLPVENMTRTTDEFGNIEEYELENPDGGGENSAITYAPHEVAELWFRKDPLEDFGRSDVELVAEQANILRDMEIDYARFVATKAYPPILWQLGTEDEKWTEDQIDGWLETVGAIEPDSMLAAGHDVDYELVGTTSTSSSAGAMRLEETFQHFQERIVTGSGVPAIIMNMEGAGGQTGEATATMPSFKRRIRRRQNRIKNVVEQQILRSLMFNSLEAGDSDMMVPEFEFGEHSSAEERLDADKAINLLNNGLLTPEAAAQRAGIDPDSELPEMWDSGDLITILQTLGGNGDNVQNPSGGSPTDTGGGAESSGGEVTSRQDPTSDPSSGRNRQSVTEDESA